MIKIVASAALQRCKIPAARKPRTMYRIDWEH